MALTGNSIEEKIYNFLYGRIKNAFGVSGLMGKSVCRIRSCTYEFAEQLRKEAGIYRRHIHNFR